MKKLSFLFLIISSFFYPQKQSSKNMEWFADAKLGIFVHYGIYSVDGVTESWSFFNGHVPYDKYMKQINGFTAKNYNPENWAKLFRESGVKYSVLTTRHHDGFTLWPSKIPNSITVMESPAKRDLIQPFVNALRNKDLKVGLYYSILDWSHPDYDVYLRDKKRYEVKDNPKRFQNFVNYYQGQLSEISKSYRPDLIWFDGDWEHNAEEQKSKETRNLLHSYNPKIIINSRLNEYGDYSTPEQGVPVTTPESEYWELCYTMNNSWGYQPNDTNYKTTNQIIQTLVDCISMGGNLLLDIGPKEDGTIPEEQIQILKNLGRWTQKHSEAIYETRRGISQEHFDGKTALSKDKKTLFLYLNANQNGNIWLRNIGSKVLKAEIVGTGKSAKIQKKNDDYFFTVAENLFDKDITVLKINLDQPFKKANNKFVLSSEGSEDEQIKKLAYFRSKNIKLSTKNSKSKSTVNSWKSKHKDLFKDLGENILDGHYSGLTAVSNDKKTLYLFVDGKPSGDIALKGLYNKIKSIKAIGNPEELNYKIYDKLSWRDTPGIIYITVPENVLDKNMTVIAVELEDEIKMHREEVKPIESN